MLPLNPGQKSPTSIYTLDNASPVTFTAPDNATSEIPDYSFFVATGLPAAVHKLVINITYVETRVPYLIDYVAYLPPESASTSLSISSSANPTNPTIPSFTGTLPQNSKSSTPVGAIVGGVIGGVALLVITGLAIWYLCRRRSRREAYFYETANPTDMLHQGTTQCSVRIACVLIVHQRSRTHLSRVRSILYQYPSQLQPCTQHRIRRRVGHSRLTRLKPP